MRCGLNGSCGWSDTTGTPGDVDVLAFEGAAAWADGETQCKISNPAFRANMHISITPIEQMAGELATVHTARGELADGYFNANRSSATGIQVFTFRVS